MNKAQKHLVIDNLSKGLNTYDPPSRVAKGFYVDAQNMVLTNKTPVTVAGMTRLNTTAAPNSAVVVWFEPYVTTSITDQFIVALDDGTLYTYVVGTNTWTHVLSNLFNTTVNNDEERQWVHVAYNGLLYFTNGSDRPMKWGGSYVLPIGSRLVATFDTTEPTDFWPGGTVSEVLGTWADATADTTAVSRFEGTASRTVAAAATGILTYTTAQNFVTALNGGTSFAATDTFSIRCYKEVADANGTFTVVFLGSAGNFFTSPVFTVNTNGWTEFTALRSAFTTTGAPNWNSIASFRVLPVTSTFHFDWAYWYYTLRPPICDFIEVYNEQMMYAGLTPSATVSATDIVFSDAGTPDEVPAANELSVQGGHNSLSQQDTVTAMRAYYDELIVGKPFSSWTVSGTGTAISVSALPLTIGIGSHRGIVETPWSLHYLFEGTIFGARLTSRGLVSSNISSLLDDVDQENDRQTVAIRSDFNHFILWSFNANSAEDTNELMLIYDYQLDAWASQFFIDTDVGLEYITKGLVDGRTSLLGCRYNGYIYHLFNTAATTFQDGPLSGAITSYVTLPYMQADSPETMDNVVRWVDATVYLSGAATVNVDARFADEPHEFDSAAFTTFGTVGATPDGDKGFVYFGRTSRWIQLRLRATSGSFRILPPIVLGYNETQRRV